ncbi:hypothetical protein ACQBAT_14680 [Ornithinimicrobium sp. Y1847]|uniref:hypothetical protein n=1 Tax=unclassified Ornithinimicrobium TaxID=2615080 RepID=UPI003B6727CF
MTHHPVTGDLGLQEEPADDVVDLVAVGDELLARARENGTGRAVRAVVRQPGQQVILLGLPAGGGLPDHDAPGPASLHCLTGRVTLSADDRTWVLMPGQVVRIPDATHAVLAHEDSTCVLVVSGR